MIGHNADIRIDMGGRQIDAGTTLRVHSSCGTDTGAAVFACQEAEVLDDAGDVIRLLDDAGAHQLGGVGVPLLVALRGHYALKDDPRGPVELRAVPAAAGQFAPQGGAAIPLAAAVFDLLDADDSRLRHVARAWLEQSATRRSGLGPHDVQPAPPTGRQPGDPARQF